MTRGSRRIWRGLVVCAVALPMLAGCAATGASGSASVARSCIDSVPGSGDLRDRAPGIGLSCAAPQATTRPAGARESAPASASPAPSPAGTPSASAASASSPPSSPSARPTPSSSSSPSAPPASLKVGQASPAGAGRYVMWIKAENHVYLVEEGAVTRVMLTTGLPWKTPPGTYSVKYKQRNSSSLDAGHAWTLPYFVAFWRRAGASGDIAFHELPHDAKGNLAQPLNTLGFPGYASDGCARMAPVDARAIWDFTEVGTRVVVR
ncbi:L,D-transpeptidase [Acidipropionibacterium virtanenii]|uniref:L,D-TPase catalytic domain-containing protein n=1 Tax=Acidipropionibacterium virtanenii TaxID=2057246 RepID=A0A344UQ64_9ACTN|nr:L,D-transpeptidase [Acidipropionibacterium virtanenii]AXE37412.1 hypothetical protein JS278_00215 [Acidipropionibacterium virtanenii]